MRRLAVSTVALALFVVVAGWTLASLAHADTRQVPPRWRHCHAVVVRPVAGHWPHPCRTAVTW